MTHMVDDSTKQVHKTTFRRVFHVCQVCARVFLGSTLGNHGCNNFKEA